MSTRASTPKNPNRSAAGKRTWAKIRSQLDDIDASFRSRFEIRRVDHEIYDDDDIVDVEEEITFEFGGAHPQHIIQRAIDQLDQHQWVVRGHPRVGSPKTAPAQPALGTIHELHARANLAASIDLTRNTLAEYRRLLGPIGHNRPRRLELDDLAPPADSPLEAAILALQQELNSALPSRKNVEEAKRGSRAWRGVWRWFQEKADRAANSVADQAGPILKVLLVGGLLTSCGDKLAEHARQTEIAADAWIERVYPEPNELDDDAIQVTADDDDASDDHVQVARGAVPKARNRRSP